MKLKNFLPAQYKGTNKFPINHNYIKKQFANSSQIFNEIKKLTQLIAEPRQDKEFKSKNFFYEGTKKNIPLTVIDRLR